MSNSENDSPIELSSDLVNQLTVQMVQHAKIWGADEDLMAAMDKLQMELETAGRGDVIEQAAKQLSEVMGRMVSADIADAEYAILERHFYFLSGEKDGAGPVPGFSVLGPTESVASVVTDTGQMVNVDGTSVQRASIKSLIRIDQDAYEMMAESGLLEDPEQPFEIMMHSANWQSDIKSENEFRLL